MPQSQEEDVIRAAGAVVWRPGGEPGPQLALVHRPMYDDWSFPKGKCQRGEHVLVTAVREVMEETSLRVVLGRPLVSSVYQVSGRTKHVSYWAAHSAQSAAFLPSAEVDELSWLPSVQARRQLTYERDVALLEDFLAGPARSAPLVLLRHAEAIKKSKANPGDLRRPLDAKGEADAGLLAAVLACYGQCRVISSAAERCLATVRPYAHEVGVRVQAEPAFTVPADRADAEHAARRMTDLAAAGLPTVVCAHRENLPLLIDAAFAAFGARPPDGPPLAKGAFWVLHSAGGVLVSAERHAPDLLMAPRGKRRRESVTGARYNGG